MLYHLQPLFRLRLTADRNVQQYEHELPLDTPILRQLRTGDRLLLLAKARYPVRMIRFAMTDSSHEFLH